MYLVEIILNSILPETAYLFLVTFYSFPNLGFISYFLYIFINIVLLGSNSLIYSYPGGRT